MLVCYVVDSYILKIQIQAYSDLDHPTPAGALGDETFPPTPITSVTSHTVNITTVDSHLLKSSSNVGGQFFLGRPLLLLPPSAAVVVVVVLW